MTTNTSNNAEILDFDLDALEDLPEFLVAPAGAYLLECVSLGQIQDEKRGVITVAKFKVLATEELVNAETDKPVADGTALEYQYPMQITNSDGTVNERSTAYVQGALKAITRPLAAFFGIKTFSELVAKFPGTQVGAILTVREYKADKNDTSPDPEMRKQSNLKSIVIG
jgi:hypothetical protein